MTPDNLVGVSSNNSNSYDPTPTPSTGQKKDLSCHLTPEVLERLLGKTTYGRKILARRSYLTIAGRKLVVDTIARYHLNTNRKASAHTMDDYAKVIVSLFTGEKMDTYFIPKKCGANPGGKLYSRINYIKQSERRRDREESAVHSSPSETKQPADVTVALEWLELNDFPWTTVLVQWEQSFPGRKAKINDLAKWPHLTKTCGYQLLDIDYRLLGHTNVPLNKWERLFKPLAFSCFSCSNHRNTHRK